MINPSFYTSLSSKSLAGEILTQDVCLQILTDPTVELLPLLFAAYSVRHHYYGKEVMVHVINNAQNGFCPEDCHYCAQAKTSKADIEEYPLKSDEEIFEEARLAHESGAFRYCMVFAGRGPSTRRVEKLVYLVREIKKRYAIEVCVSAGLMDKQATQQLKDAGLDRLNHNLNTSQDNYPNICTTHTYQQRLETLKAANDVGLTLCSGMIVGMNESHQDIVAVAKQLRELKTKSIPVNFLIPIEGNTLKQISSLTPEFCLRVLCLFRLLNPESELRVAAGREWHLRRMEVLSLYPANSLFIEGYLNTRGHLRTETLQMIKDAGFTIKSEVSVDELLKQELSSSGQQGYTQNSIVMKDLDDLRPSRKKHVF